MIDIENDVFNLIATKARAAFPNVSVASEYKDSPSTFPHISIIMEDYGTYLRTRTGSCGENHAEVMFEVNTYSNKKSGKKSECKKIAQFIHDEFIALGFECNYFRPAPNVDDNTIYRMLGRYRAVVSKDKTIYRR